VRALTLIVTKELSAYFGGRSGYAIAAALLLVDGLLFNLLAMSGSERLSSTILSEFFNYTSGVTMIAGILLSMRLFAEESRDGTMVLLATAPIEDWQVAVGKWLSAFAFLCVFLATTLYMPLLVMVNGTVSAGQLFAGYLGLALLGAATTAIGTLASSLTRSQVLAGVIGGVIVTALVLSWKMANATEAPFDTIFSYLALHNKHFMPFMRGSIHLRDIVYYLSITFMALLLTQKVLATRRWG